MKRVPLDFNFLQLYVKKWSANGTIIKVFFLMLSFGISNTFIDFRIKMNRQLLFNILNESHLIFFINYILCVSKGKGSERQKSLRQKSKKEHQKSKS